MSSCSLHLNPQQTVAHCTVLKISDEEKTKSKINKYCTALNIYRLLIITNSLISKRTPVIDKMHLNSGLQHIIDTGLVKSYK